MREALLESSVFLSSASDCTLLTFPKWRSVPWECVMMCACIHMEGGKIKEVMQVTR